MRPPEFTGGNLWQNEGVLAMRCCFNEAAGIHRRKRGRTPQVADPDSGASMRPPEFTGGNLGAGGAGAAAATALQ